MKGTQLGFWQDKRAWKKAGYNTLHCLIGCSIGDFGTILFFQLSNYSLSTFIVMFLAIVNGLVTSFILELIILSQQMVLKKAIQTSLSMSFISMITMEITMNAIDWIIIGKAELVLWLIPIMLMSGFLSVWPYNYWRLKKYNISCH